MDEPADRLRRRSMKSLLGRTALGGAALMLIGAAFLWEAAGYRLGTARSMGPGYFPAAIAGLMVLIGLCLLLQGLAERASAPSVPLRATLAILAAIAFFGLAVTTLGLVPAIAGAVILSALAEPVQHRLRLAGLVAVLVALSWAIFIEILRLPIPLLRVPL